MRFLLNLITVLFHKLSRKKTDFFLDFKYDKLREYYGKSCLDVGAGTGRFSKYLAVQKHNVQPIDIVDKCEFEELNLQKFDGKNINQADDSFDTTLFMFVLHHTDDQEVLLESCRRVTKEFIIVAEDVIQNKFDRMMGNIHLGTSPWARSKNGFKTDSEWLHFFAKSELELVKCLKIPRRTYPVYPVTRKIYVLRVSKVK